MTITKTRTTIIALVAAFSFTAASVVPTVSEARKSDPATNAKAKKAADKQVVADLCSTLGEMLSGHVEAYENAKAEGNPEAASARLAEAMTDIKEGKRSGCAWAARLRLPSETSPTSGVVAPVGRAIQGAPQAGTLPPVQGILATSSRPQRVAFRPERIAIS